MRTSGAPYRENAKLYPAVIACDKREAFALGSVATKQSVLSSCREVDCFASLAMTQTGRSRLDTPRSWRRTTLRRRAKSSQTAA